MVKTSHEFGVHDSTIRTVIATLEREIGTELVLPAQPWQRNHITTAGRILSNRAFIIINELKKAKHEIADYLKGILGEIKP